jgi:hypothetical protein
MSRRIVIAALLVAASAVPAAAGPPWISVELPANPHHASTRSASLLLRAYHHSDPLSAPITGVAEGIVDGRRVSHRLELRATNQPGVYAVVTPLPKGGTWVLAFTVAPAPEATATALVTVDPRGRIVGVDVPSNRSRDGWSVPRRVEPRDIEAALRAADVAFGGSDERRYGYAAALPLLLVGVLAFARRRVP